MYTKKVIRFYEVQIELGILYFYLLSMAVLQRINVWVFNILVAQRWAGSGRPGSVPATRGLCEYTEPVLFAQRGQIPVVSEILFWLKIYVPF